MANIMLNKSSISSIRRQLERMQAESENAEKKARSALNGLDFEVASKENVKSSLSKIIGNINKQSESAAGYRNAFVSVSNTLAETDAKFGSNSASIIEKIRGYVDNIISDIKTFFNRNKLIKYSIISGLFLPKPSVTSWVITVETLRRIAEWLRNFFGSGNGGTVENANTSDNTSSETTTDKSEHGNNTNESDNKSEELPEQVEEQKQSKLTPEQQAMVDRLNNSSSLKMSETKRKTLVKMAETLLAEGYEPAFVAGILGNIYHEGEAGKFESSAYKSNKPKYLAYLDEHYDYRNKYSGQNIEGKSLSELYNMVKELEQNGHFMSGIGCVQWSGSRTKALIETYMEVAAPNDTITAEQIYEAEALMISKELKGDYSKVYQNWKNNNSGNLASIDAAKDAGSRVCTGYEKPAGFREKSIPRGDTAQSIYTIMLG